MAAAAEAAAIPPPETHVIDLTGDSSESDEGDESENGSDASEVEIHLNEETRSQLRKAIATVSEARLRHVLNELIITEQAVEIALTKEFVTVKRNTKNVVPRWERCANCDTEYDVNSVEEEDDECAFHPGELEMDEDGFADWEEETHGPRDTSENRRQYPEEFMWSCCERDGTAVGCVRGQHVPAEVSKKRKRE